MGVSRTGRWMAAAGALLGCCACGSTTASSPTSASGAAPAPWTAGVVPARSTFVAQCATPRTGIDPGTGKPYPDKPGSTLAENNWLRSWTHELYLWYREVPDRNPAGQATADYFNVLKTPATTASGQPKDKFHFTYPTAQWESLSQSGVDVGYGVQWVIVSSRPPRQVVVAYTEPNSPATAPSANLA